MFEYLKNIEYLCSSGLFCGEQKEG